MTGKPLNDMRQYLVDEFLEEYQEGHLTRRQALRQLTLILGSGATASALLAACAAPATHTTAPAATKPATGSGAASPVPATSAATPAAKAATTAATTPGAATAGTPAAATKPAGTPATAATSPAVAATKPAANPVTVPPTDPAITSAGMVEHDGPAGELMGYLARPAGAGPHPLLIVIHENRGLTDHIQDVVRRGAKAGYITLGPDLLSRVGGTARFTDPQQATGAIGQLEPEQVIDDLKATIAYLQGREGAQRERLGVTGFCWGGGQTWRIAVAAPEIKAAVPFYGPPAPPAQIAQIRAAVLGIYAGNDTRINAALPQAEEALRAANITHKITIYPDVNHAFHNDTGGNYAPDAARAAWAEAIAWLDQYVKAG